MDRGQTVIVKCTFYTDHFISCPQFYMLIADAKFTAQTVDMVMVTVSININIISGENYPVLTFSLRCREFPKELETKVK